MRPLRRRCEAGAAEGAGEWGLDAEAALLMVVGAAAGNAEGGIECGSSLRICRSDMVDGDDAGRSTQRASAGRVSDENCYVFLRV